MESAIDDAIADIVDPKEPLRPIISPGTAAMSSAQRKLTACWYDYEMQRTETMHPISTLIPQITPGESSE